MKIKKKIPLIGIVARYDLAKDHENLINALSIIRLKNINFLCFLVGSNINKNNIKGHSEIAPGRKSDPGNLFNWERYLNGL